MPPKLRPPFERFLNGALPERILVTIPRKANEWREKLVLRITEKDKLLVVTPSRHVSEKTCNHESLSEIKIWPLDRDRCPKGVRKADIGDSAADSAEGQFQPGEVTALLRLYK